MLRVGDETCVRRVEGGSRKDRVDWMLKGGCSVRTRLVLFKEIGRWLFKRERYGKRKQAEREAEARALVAARKVKKRKRMYEAVGEAVEAATVAALAAAPDGGRVSKRARLAGALAAAGALVAFRAL
jgi:hypothetical protein